MEALERLGRGGLVSRVQQLEGELERSEAEVRWRQREQRNTQQGNRNLLRGRGGVKLRLGAHLKLRAAQGGHREAAVVAGAGGCCSR